MPRIKGLTSAVAPITSNPSIRTNRRLAEFEYAASEFHFDVLRVAETWRSGRETVQLASGCTLLTSGAADPSVVGTGVGFYVGGSTCTA